MGFPLLIRRLILGFQGHIDQGRGGANDYEANYVTLFAPISGVVFLFEEPQGGNWIRITDSLGRRWEMAHLSERFVTTGQTVHVGQKIGITGNTGNLTSGPHLHLQLIKDGVRIDPWTLLKDAPLPIMSESYNNTIIRAQAGPYTGSFAYVKGVNKQLITRENAGLALITFIQRSDELKPLKKQITNVEEQVWNSFTTVPDKTWF